MSTNTLLGPALTLGSFLRDRRAQLAPTSDATSRRRTPGLRREEVAARAGVSITWYTWLEQGRGGPPSADVLERLAHALELDGDGREVLFLLGQHRPPPVKSVPPSPVAPHLQGVLDALLNSPAIVKTPTWDVVAWNAAAVAVLADYAAVPPEERNVLRRLFTMPRKQATLPEWEADARFAIGVFRMDVARNGSYPEAEALAAELQEASADFRRLWAENEIRAQWIGSKRILHPKAGPIALDYSSYAVTGADGLSMVVFTPATPTDAATIARLLA